MKPPLVDAEERKKLFQHFKPSSRVKISVRIMAVSRVASGNKHAVGSVEKGLYYEKGVYTTGTGDPDDPEVCGLFKTAHTGRIGASVGAPVAEESHDSQFLSSYPWHMALTSAKS
jgi:hypothetical protein